MVRSSIPLAGSFDEQGRFSLSEGAELLFFSNAVGEAAKLLNDLNETVAWERPVLKIFGREVLQPRDTCYVADANAVPYSYSRYKPIAHGWDDFPALATARQIVEHITGESFNSALLNRYRWGQDYVSWHSDSEAVYLEDGTIASLSLGASREFYLKPKAGVGCGYSLELTSGDVLVMKGYVQRDWLHSLPKRKDANPGVRINITFRQIRTASEIHY